MKAHNNNITDKLTHDEHLQKTSLFSRKRILIILSIITIIISSLCINVFADNPLYYEDKYVLTINTENIAETMQAVTPYGQCATGPLSETTIIDKDGNSIKINNYKICASNKYYTVDLNYQKGSQITSCHRAIELNLDTSTNEYVLNIYNQYYVTDSIVADMLNNTLSKYSFGINAKFIKVSIDTDKDNSITGIFTKIGTWITKATTTIISLFYINNSLTFIGYLAIGSLALSVGFLIIKLLIIFLHFRG